MKYLLSITNHKSKSTSINKIIASQKHKFKEKHNCPNKLKIQNLINFTNLNCISLQLLMVSYQ